MHNAGTVRYERDTRTTHVLSLTFTDDAVAPIEDGDTIELLLITRNGAATIRLTSSQADKMMHGDRRARKADTEDYGL